MNFWDKLFILVLFGVFVLHAIFAMDLWDVVFVLVLLSIVLY